ncbi:sugar phosphate nucleotidyltransferase [Nanoarchaeota archaeon]
MQVIIPVAGKGTRMRPHTHTIPKPLLHVAGKPVIDYILDELKELPVSEVIFITGHLKEHFEEHMKATYDFKMRFIEQEVLDGTSGAIRLARDYIHEDVLIIFADTIFDSDLSILKNFPHDGAIWCSKVEDHRRWGIIITDDDGFMTKLIEKPDKPYTRLANIGMHYMKNYKLLFECIEEQYEKDLKAKGEYPLPEAHSMMCERGEKHKAIQVEGWYDTGKPETVLATQEVLLHRRHREGKTKKTEIIKPVYIEDGSDVEGCVIGPNVSIAKGAVVKNSVVKNSIIGVDSSVENCSLEESFVGDEAKVFGVSGKVNVGDHSEVVIGDEDNT